MKHSTFIVISRPADGHYDFQHATTENGTPMWEEIRQRLFDTSPVSLHKSEFCNQIMRAIWTCIYDDLFVIELRAGVKVYDDREYVRPLKHILLDLVELAQTKPEKSHRLIRHILGSDNLSDRFIGAANSAGIIIEREDLEATSKRELPFLRRADLQHGRISFFRRADGQIELQADDCEYERNPLKSNAITLDVISGNRDAPMLTVAEAGKLRAFLAKWVPERKGSGGTAPASGRAA